MTTVTISEDAIIRIARHAHEANRIYCASIGDHSQKDWAGAPQWQKDSAIAGVRMHVNNPLATPADSHVSWYNHKLADGWKYGDVKDEAAKTHPCMVSYDELPVEQRVKDTVYANLVKAALYIEMNP